MKLPDGPSAEVFWSQRLANPLETLENCAKRYGDIFAVRSPNSPLKVIFSHPHAVREVFTAEPHLFDAGKSNLNLQPFVGKHSVALLDSTPHRRQRQLLMPPFHGERMRSYGQLIGDIAEQVTSEWTDGKQICVRSCMQELTLRIILCAVFGLEEGSRFQQLRQLLISGLDSASSAWQGLLTLRQQIDELIYAEIRQRREQSDLTSADILTLLLSARDETGETMTDEELRDELITLLMAGHETTAAALSWAFYWIHHLPEVGDRLLEELKTINGNTDPTEIARLPYLSAVCQETLRYYPVTVFTFSRILKLPFELAGYQFEPGTILSPCAYLTHHREDIYPEPKQFKPERFLDRQFSPYEYYPFGGGNRRCIGMAFALFEMKLILASILTRFQLALANNCAVKPVLYGVAISPPQEMPLIAMARRYHAQKS
jgi:cytochrome P450